MKKNWIALVVALVILTVSTSALAAQPSKTTEDLTRVIGVETKAGNADSSLIGVETTLFEAAKTQLTAIKSFLAKKNTISNYFSDDVKKGMSALLPTGTDLTKLTMSEYVALGIGKYDATMGDVTATFQFPTAFAADKTVIAMVGYEGSDGTMIWQALQTTVVNGNLHIVFPSDLMTKVGNNAILAVLSN
ncbi:MAG: hypothetical protein PHW41_05360 [Eubacteriales bacterium]|nr:hypothetical protein [Eubacteriales bacterium]